MTLPEIIAACAGETGLPFLVIGGLAVIAYGYPRDTVDLDYVVRGADRDGWLKALGGFGYKPVHEHGTFAQFVSELGGVDLDLMFVNHQTFDGLFAASVMKPVGPVSVRFPSLEHLIALKLHVAKQDLPHRVMGDMDDIVNLALANSVNLREEKWRQLFLRHGTLELYEKVLRATGA